MRTWAVGVSCITTSRITAAAAVLALFAGAQALGQAAGDAGIGASIRISRPGTTLVATRSGRAYAAVATSSACTGRYERIIPVAAKVQGVGTSLWRFDLGIYADEAASVDVALLVKNQANPNPAVVNVQVPANEEVILQNVLGTLFNVANAGLGIRFCSGFPLVEGYFYNAGGTPGVVYGAAVPALDERQAARSFRPAIFHNLVYTPSAVQGRRINIGATSNSDHDVDMRIDLYDGPTLLGSINHTLLPYEHRQFTNVHQMIGSPAVASGHAVVRMLTDPAEVYTYALQVQNKSGDLVYQAANLAPPPFGPIEEIFNGTWTGTWHNETFGSSGSVTWTIDIDDTGAAAAAPAPTSLVDSAASGMPPGVLGAASEGEALLGAYVPGPSIGRLTINYNGNVFGGPDPPATTLLAYKVLGGLLFYGTVPVFGEYNIFINEKGRIAGTLVKIPNPAISFVSMWGRVAYNQMQLDMKVGLGGTSYAMTSNVLSRPQF